MSAAIKGRGRGRGALGSVRARHLGSAALGLALLVTASAHAQEAEEPETVVVSASRVDREGYTAPTPTSIVSSADIEVQGASNIASILNQMSQFTADTAPTTAGGQSMTVAATYADLRGLGAIRTLVLVDGLRFVPQVITARNSNQVDLNQIPTILIERVEVVTGGASASWGSDAIGGVINIILHKRFEGLKIEGSAGQSIHDDHKNSHLAGLGGITFDNGRGSIEVAGTWDRNLGVGSQLNRDWGREAWGYIPNPSPGVNGLPVRLLARDVQYSSYTPGGIINNTVLRGIAFGPGGVPYPFQYGDFVSASTMSGGGNLPLSREQGNGPNSIADIEPSYTRVNAYGRVTYDFSENLTAYADILWAKITPGYSSPTARDTAIPIYRENPFLPASVRDLMIANGVTVFNLGRISWDIGRATAQNTTETVRGVIGVQGTLGENWTWDAAATYGDNVFTQQTHNARVRANFRLAADVVSDPVTGDPICRSTLTNPTNGCVPMNVFGNGSVSAAAADYVTDTTFSETTYRQFAAELNIQGEPFSLWAGPVSVAAGYAFRREAQESITDPIAAIGGYEGNNSAPMHGAYHVHEGYLEAVVPLATDTSWAKSLEINGAIRGAEYNTAAGFQTSWKYGVTYRPPLEGLLIRAVHSSDIRAPDIYELHSGVVITTGNLIFGTKANPLATFYNYGNPDLQPETARTTSFGFSYQPDFIPGLGLSADYYHINLTDQISTITGQQVADFCYRGLTSFCSLLTLAPDGTPQSVVVNFLNIAGTETDGIDMTGTYRFPVEAVVAGVPGDVSLRATATYTIHSKVDAGTGAGPEEHAGMVSSPTPGSSGFADTPHWRAVLSVGYDRGPLSVHAQFRYIGAAKVNNAWTEHNPAPTSVNENDIPSVTYVDLFATYDVTDSAQIFLTGHNLFDKDPPRAAGPIFYDYLGTTYQLGARVTF